MTAVDGTVSQGAPSGPVRRGPRRSERAEPVRRSVTRRDQEGTDLGTVELEPAVFGIEPNLAVLHQVVTAQLAAARAGTQSTRTRAEVRGGGAKPFRQKGTGRARQGSTRSPQWVGGGVALGPKPRSYRQKTPKKMVRLALCSALSDRAAEGRVALVDDWTWEVPRTKAALAALAALGLNGKVLVVLEPGAMVAERSFANLPDCQVLQAGELSAYDILVNDWVLFTDATLPGAVPAGDAELVVEVIDEETGDVDVVDIVVDETTGETLAELQEAEYVSPPEEVAEDAGPAGGAPLVEDATEGAGSAEDARSGGEGAS